MGQFQYEITEILHPSTRHKWSRNIVCRHAGIHACCCTSIQLFIRSTNHTVIHACSHLYAYLHSRLYIYTVKQSIDRYFNSPNSHSIVSSAKSSYGRTPHVCFSPLSLMSSRWQQEALLPMNRMAESSGIFAAGTIPT